jgi:WXG100 family type VII secretion target
MNETAGMRIRVKTEELAAIADEVENQISSMRRQLDVVGNIVNKSTGYWEGEGQNAYMERYRSKSDEVENALKRFSDDVVNLRTIAGIYVTTEEAATEAANSLSSDVIV